MSHAYFVRGFGHGSEAKNELRTEFRYRLSFQTFLKVAQKTRSTDGTPPITFQRRATKKISGWPAATPH